MGSIRKSIKIPIFSKKKTAANSFVRSFLKIIYQFLFHHTLTESTTFAPGSETRMWYFRPGYDEKLYTKHGDKKKYLFIFFSITAAAYWPSWRGPPWCISSAQSYKHTSLFYTSLFSLPKPCCASNNPSRIRPGLCLWGGENL